MSWTPFQIYSGVKPDKTECEIAGVGVLNGIQVAFCGIKYVSLKNETLKILSSHFWYNKNFEQDKTFANILQK